MFQQFRKVCPRGETTINAGKTIGKHPKLSWTEGRWRRRQRPGNLVLTRISSCFEGLQEPGSNFLAGKGIKTLKRAGRGKYILWITVEAEKIVPGPSGGQNGPGRPGKVPSASLGTWWWPSLPPRLNDLRVEEEVQPVKLWENDRETHSLWIKKLDYSEETRTRRRSWTHLHIWQ